jgi:hypothetical protein
MAVAVPDRRNLTNWRSEPKRSGVPESPTLQEPERFSRSRSVPPHDRSSTACTYRHPPAQS